MSQTHHSCAVSDLNSVSITGEEKLFDLLHEYSVEYYTRLTKNTSFMNNPLRVSEIENDKYDDVRVGFRDVLDAKSNAHIYGQALSDIEVNREFWLYVQSQNEESPHSTKDAENIYSIGPATVTLSGVFAHETIEYLAIDVEKSIQEGEVWVTFGGSYEDSNDDTSVEIKTELLSRLIEGSIDREICSLYRYEAEPLLVALGFYPIVKLGSKYSGTTVVPSDGSYPIDLLEGDDSAVLYNTEMVSKEEVQEHLSGDRYEKYSHEEQGEFHTYPDFAIEYFVTDDASYGSAVAGLLDGILKYATGDITKEELQILALLPFAVGEPYLDEAIEYGKEQWNTVMSALEPEDLDPPIVAFCDRDKISADISRDDIVCEPLSSDE